MVDFPEKSEPRQQAESKIALNLGLAALQRKNYAEAIAHLEPLTGDRRRSVQTRALVGLAQAYAAQGKRQEAIALCQTLARSPEASARQWAAAMQQRLEASTHASNNGGGSAASEAAPSRSALDADLAANLTRRNVPKLPTPASSPPQTQRSNGKSGQPFGKKQSANPPRISSRDVAETGNRNETPPTPPAESLADERSPTSTEAVSSRGAAPTGVGNAPSVAWRYAGRAEKGRSLGAPDRARLIAVEGVTILLLIGFGWAIAQLFLTGYNAIMVRITFSFLNLSRLAIFVEPLWWVAGFVGLGLVVAPWFWLWHLRRGMKAHLLDLRAVEARSPETARLLQRFTRKYGGKIQLQCLPVDVPVAFSYGHWLGPRCVVLSQAVFDQLNDDEIAALVAGELTHFRFWDGAVLSGVVALLQLPYGLYQWASEWGDSRNSPIFRIPAILFSVLGYGIFWVGRLAGLWLSRMRLYYSDRAACELTGNPNGLTRALLKLAIGKAQVVWEREETPYLLERLDLLTPVGRQEALTLGSLYPYYPGTELLEWDRSNPHRRWLSVLEAHPPLGDRLHRLDRVAQKWKLPQELEFPAVPARTPKNWRTYLPLLIQAAPIIGLLIGLIVGQGLWWFGIYAERLRSVSLDWLRNDFIHLVCMAIGLGIGTFLRLNLFFPEVKRINTLPAGDLPELLRPPEAMPAHRQTLRFQGTLIGRRGLANAIAQDLLLKTDQGLLRLHFLPFLSFSENPISGWRQVHGFLHKTILVSGWFRRGVTPWLDLNSLHTHNGKAMRSGHPIWAAAIGMIAVLWGCYMILTGDI